MKEVKEEANKMKALSQVRAAVIKFFKLNSWQEAETKFGASVHPERLLRFKVSYRNHYVTFINVNLNPPSQAVYEVQIILS